MANSLAKFGEATKQFRSHDWRRVRGAHGQLSLWPDRYVDEGWQRRQDIRQFPDYFAREPVPSECPAKP